MMEVFVVLYFLVNFFAFIAVLLELILNENFLVMDEIEEEGLMVKHIFLLLIFLPCVITMAVFALAIGLLVFIFEKVIPFARIDKFLNTRLFGGRPERDEE